jgi:hypothetical protein
MVFSFALKPVLQVIQINATNQFESEVCFRFNNMFNVALSGLRFLNQQTVDGFRDVINLETMEQSGIDYIQLELKSRPNKMDSNDELVKVKFQIETGDQIGNLKQLRVSEL